jgi:hypothetical protein
LVKTVIGQPIVVAVAVTKTEKNSEFDKIINNQQLLEKRPHAGLI